MRDDPIPAIRHITADNHIQWLVLPAGGVGMNEAKAVKIAVECILEKQRAIRSQASYYERDPLVFKKYRGYHERYLEYTKAIETLETMASQKRLF